MTTRELQQREKPMAEEDAVALSPVPGWARKLMRVPWRRPERARVNTLVALALRGGALLVLGALALAGYLSVRTLALAGHADAELLQPQVVLGVTYAAACWLMLRTHPLLSRGGRWAELGLILGLGVVFRLLYWQTPPLLSHDAYRYAWDPYLLAHGISPYLHAPIDPALAPLRDHTIFPNLNWPSAPTIYPPGAQAFFLLVYLVAPLNIFAVKAAIEVCDVLSAVLAMALLRRYGLDRRRVLIYWWSPIAVVEFASSAHVDAVAILWTLAALVAAGQCWRGARGLAGVLLGLAALTKLYPLLFALAIIRRRDRTLVLALAGTVLLGYLPFLGDGPGLTGFLGTYFTQRFVDQGIVLQVLSSIDGLVHGSARSLLALQAVALLALCAVIVWWRWRTHEARPERGVLALSAAWIVVSPHLFPWYVAILLPLVALDLRLPERDATADVGVESSGRVAPALALALWLFALAMPFTYVIFAPGGNAHLFVLFFLVPAAGATLPLLLRATRPRYGIMKPTHTSSTSAWSVRREGGASEDEVT
jgi:Glycosyltransferase family 87